MSRVAGVMRGLGLTPGPRPRDASSAEAAIRVGGLGAIVLGVVLLALYSIPFIGRYPEALVVLAGGLMIGGAAFMVGGLLGFVFAIPRSLQDDRPPPRRDISAENGGTEPRDLDTRYRGNTNFEQISDWLTKILVGVGLVQLGEIRAGLVEVGETVEPLVGESAVGQAIIIWYGLLGLMLVYLWTRLALPEALTKAEARALEGQVAAFEEEARLRRAQKQQELDDEAADLVRRQLAGDLRAEEDRERLRSAVRDSSPNVRASAFFDASRQRKESWRSDKPRLERTVPIFEALVEADGDGKFFRSHGDLGFALKDKAEPDFRRAIEAFDRAIEIRDARGERGFKVYEWCRAFCRISADKPFRKGNPSDNNVREAILKDLRASYSSYAKWNDREPIAGWLELNDPNEELESGLDSRP